MSARDTTTALNSYVTDMLSLESHIEKAVRSQVQDLKDYPDLLPLLRDAHRKVEHHLADLKDLAERRDATGAAEAVKRAGAAVAGMAAGLVDMVRSEGLPKHLRDDYTAFNLACIGYLMLHTTARSFGEHEVADLARQHYADYADLIMRLHQAVPQAVIEFLQEEGLPAKREVLSEIAKTSEEVWRQESSSSTRGVQESTTTRIV